MTPTDTPTGEPTLTERLQQAVEAARDTVLDAAVASASPNCHACHACHDATARYNAAITRYGDLRALEGRYVEHKRLKGTGYHAPGHPCSLEAEIEAALRADDGSA